MINQDYWSATTMQLAGAIPVWSCACPPEYPKPATIVGLMVILVHDIASQCAKTHRNSENE